MSNGIFHRKRLTIFVFNCDLWRFFRFQKFNRWNDWTRDWPWLCWANFRKLWTRGQEYIFQIEFIRPRFSYFSSYTDTSARLNEFDQDLIKLTPTMLNIFTQPRDHFLLCKGIKIWNWRNPNYHGNLDHPHIILIPDKVNDRASCTRWFLH